MKGRILFYVTVSFGLLAAHPTRALEVSRLDDFQDGATQDREAGEFHPTPPANAGREGNDRYLQVTSLDGEGPGSRLSMFNIGRRRAGDYLDTGITALTAEVANPGDTDVDLLLLWGDSQEEDLPPANVAVTAAVPLAVGSDWTETAFSIMPETLTAIAGNVEDLLADVTELRLFHNPAPDFPSPQSPPAVVAEAGIDNIRAIPEPATIILLAAGAGGLIRRRRKT